uniref:hypothetical protein n=1 Tax=Pedobacter frigidisoli TaxID=2530455 RepID=UPI0021D14D57|nr:hypothetical protein [Pedobacter frigidisoli]
MTTARIHKVEKLVIDENKINSKPPIIDDKICTGRKPIISVSFPPTAEPKIEPTPNRVIIKPASISDRCKLWVTYKPIKGTAILPHLLNIITILKSQVSRLKPLKDVLYVFKMSLNMPLFEA